MMAAPGRRDSAASFGVNWAAAVEPAASRAGPLSAGNLGFVGVLFAWNVAYGVIHDDAANPYETGRLPLIGRRRD
jgi:hypothetical protein